MRVCALVCASGTGNSVAGEGRERRPVTEPARGLSLSLTHILCARKSIRICAHSKDPTVPTKSASTTRPLSHSHAPLLPHKTTAHPAGGAFAFY